MEQDFLERAPEKIWSSIETFKPTRGCFKAWCYRVLLNFANDLGRERKRRREVLFSQLKTSSKATESGQEKDWLERVSRDEPVDELLIQNEPLSKREIQNLEESPPLQRIIVVALAGLVPRMDPQTWDR